MDTNYTNTFIEILSISLNSNIIIKNVSIR